MYQPYPQHNSVFPHAAGNPYVSVKIDFVRLLQEGLDQRVVLEATLLDAIKQENLEEQHRAVQALAQHHQAQYALFLDCAQRMSPLPLPMAQHVLLDPAFSPTGGAFSGHSSGPMATIGRFTPPPVDQWLQPNAKSNDALQAFYIHPLMRNQVKRMGEQILRAEKSLSLGAFDTFVRDSLKARERPEGDYTVGEALCALCLALVEIPINEMLPQPTPKLTGYVRGLIRDYFQFLTLGEGVDDVRVWCNKLSYPRAPLYLQAPLFGLVDGVCKAATSAKTKSKAEDALHRAFEQWLSFYILPHLTDPNLSETL